MVLNVLIKMKTRIYAAPAVKGLIMSYGAYIGRGAETANIVASEQRLMFAHRLQRWANISPALGQRAMFAGVFSSWGFFC